MRMVAGKMHKLMMKTLETDVAFQEKVRVYLLKSPGDGTFYDNRLHFDKEDGLWLMVEVSRQCTYCGQMLLSSGGKEKLLSCGRCKSAHYCDKECQKLDWKEGHKLVCCPQNDEVALSSVMRLCIRALTCMRFFVEAEDEMGIPYKCMSKNVMKSILCKSTDSRSRKYKDLVQKEKSTLQIFDRVCDYFCDKKEANRILYPIWETATGILSFVPISLDFMSNGLGVPDALMASFQEQMSHKQDNFFVLVIGKVNGKIAVVGGDSFIHAPGTELKSCEEAGVEK